MAPKQPPGLTIEAFCDADEYDRACLPADTHTDDWEPKPVAEDVEVLEDHALLRFVERVADVTLAPIKKSSLFEPIPDEILKMILSQVAINNLRKPVTQRYGRKSQPTVSHHLFKARIVCRRFALIGGVVFENIVKQKDSPYSHYRQLIVSARDSPLLIGDTFTASSIDFRDLIDGIRVPLTITFCPSTTLYEFLKMCEKYHGWEGETMPSDDQLSYAMNYANMRAAQKEQYKLCKLISQTTYTQDLQKLLLKCRNVLSMTFDWYSCPSTWQVLYNWNRFCSGDFDEFTSHTDIDILRAMLKLMPNQMTRLSIPVFALRVAEFDEFIEEPMIDRLTSLTFELDPFIESVMREWLPLPAQCQSLDSLTISFENHEPNTERSVFPEELDSMIKDTHWRHLRFASFSGLCCSSETLQKFVATHRKTLRELHLFNLALHSHENWYDLLVGLKFLRPRLHKCTIRTLDCVRGSPELFREAFPNHVRRIKEHSWEDGGRYLLDIGSYLSDEKGSGQP